MPSRYLLSECPCGYKARVTRIHLRAYGPPLCPNPECGARALDCPEFDAAFGHELEAWETMAERETVYRPMRETERRAAKIHECSSCHIDIQIGEHYLESVYTLDGALHHERKCLACQLPSHRSTRAAFRN